MEKIHSEIKVEPDNMVLARTPRWQPSPTVMTTVLAAQERVIAIFKRNFTSMTDKDKLLKNSLWVRYKRHKVNCFVNMSPDTQCLMFCYSDDIKLNCSTINNLRCQHCPGLYTTRNQRCKVIYCGARDHKIYVNMNIT